MHATDARAMCVKINKIVRLVVQTKTFGMQITVAGGTVQFRTKQIYYIQTKIRIEERS
jgi:hypothetical protein